MLRSMTGFGKAEHTFSDAGVRVEIRSLNGKMLDLNLKIPPLLKPYEFEIRSILKNNLWRGSLDVFIQVTRHGASRPMEINTGLARSYFESINAMISDFQLPKDNLMSAILQLPEVVAPSAEELSESEWEQIKQVLEEAIQKLDAHRINEGKVLEKELLLRIQNIENFQAGIRELEPLRKEKIRKRLEDALSEWMSKEQIDKNRLEQELIFYIEKLDITEEQVRLANHCRYFREILKEESPAKGKKLNFILQETGREINTTGAKANDAELQRYVVQMKDELEKAKEQIMNVL